MTRYNPEQQQFEEAQRLLREIKVVQEEFLRDGLLFEVKLSRMAKTYGPPILTFNAYFDLDWNRIEEHLEVEDVEELFLHEHRSSMNDQETNSRITDAACELLENQSFGNLLARNVTSTFAMSGRKTKLKLDVNRDEFPSTLEGFKGFVKLLEMLHLKLTSGSFYTLLCEKLYENAAYSRKVDYERVYKPRLLNEPFTLQNIRRRVAKTTPESLLSKWRNTLRGKY